MDVDSGFTTANPLDSSSVWGPTDDYEDDSGALCSDGAQRLGQTLLPVLYSIVFILGLVGNGLAFLVLVRRQRRGYGSGTWDTTQVFLLNLAAADLLLVATLPLWARHAAREWPFGEWACKLATALYSVSFYCGVFVLTCLSVDRYLVVVRATRCRGVRWRRRRAWVACAGAWSAATLLSLLDVLSSRAQLQADTPDSAPRTVCQSLHAGPGGHVRKAALAVFQTAACFLLPFAIMLACYVRIAVTLAHTKSRGSRRKAVRVIVALVLLFFLCWLPYNAVLLVVALADLRGTWLGCRTHEALHYARQTTETLAFTHCCLNPLLYAFVGVRFREDLYRMLGDVRSTLCSLLTGSGTARQAAGEASTGTQSMPTHSGEARSQEHPQLENDGVPIDTLQDLPYCLAHSPGLHAESSHIFSGVSTHSWVYF
ncbi:C-X-C chemokine receptor type 3-like [Lethenteron reissneri]|uniref:CXCR3 n=1 Tax=Eudontomyzon morii TaxID=682880 RepID=A0A7T0IGD8_9PETR|nr:C-X-C chemokine receptor type 3-like [Lethenteron reissneri]QPK40943.1 CXCR3 [Eudontomyzon morii]